MFPQKAAAVGASGMIAPMPTMAMGCRSGLSGWMASCGFAVISLSPSRGCRAGASVEDVGDAVHVCYQSFLRRACGVESKAGAGARHASGSGHQAQAVAGHLLCGVTGEHPAHRGERAAVEPMIGLLRQLAVERGRGTAR